MKPLKRGRTGYRWSLVADQTHIDLGFGPQHHPACLALAGFLAGQVVRCQYDPGQTALGWESMADTGLFPSV